MGEMNPAKLTLHAAVTALLLGLFCSVAGAAAPVITDVYIARQSDTRSATVVFYGQSVDVTVTDADGASDLASVVVVFPDGTSTTALATDSDTQPGDEYTLTFSFRPNGDTPRSLTPPAAGLYTITAADAGGLTDSLTATTAPVTALTAVSPADVTVITDDHPTFEWRLGGLQPDCHCLRLWESGDGTSGSSCPLWCSTVDPATQIVFDADGSAVHHELLPGRAYLWDVMASYVEDDHVTDPRVAVGGWAWMEQRFALPEDREAMPTIEGKLVYTTNPGNGVAIRSSQFYTSDATRPSWFGPVGAVYADWSPDGSKLIYSQEPERYLWVDSLNGSPPTPLGITGFDARWSPDGTRLCFSRYLPDHSTFNLWVSNADGTDARALDPGPDLQQRYCSWSADGQWISYRRFPLDLGVGLWLVRPDGTDNHPVVFTGVEGYPGFWVGFTGENAWAPDGQRLAIAFDAEDGLGGYIKGLGVVSRDGGMVKPILLTPDAVACCADVHIPWWAPDGTHILFSAALQVPPDPDWPNQGLEQDVELWLLNADGSGEPVRLTNDRMFESYVSWWGPDIFPDVPKGNWAYCAISACHQAGIVNGYPGGDYAPLLPVSRDQMAVYLTRALAGGGVPTGPATASFPDVPTDFWAFAYIEYAAAHGVVGGYPDGLYHPEILLDRAQMAVFLARGLTGGDEFVPSGPATPSFPDVPADFWAYRHVEYIKALGVTGGYGDGLYHPEYACTRDQMAMLVARAFHLPM